MNIINQKQLSYGKNLAIYFNKNARINKSYNDWYFEKLYEIFSYYGDYNLIKQKIDKFLNINKKNINLQLFINDELSNIHENKINSNIPSQIKILNFENNKKTIKEVMDFVCNEMKKKGLDISSIMIYFNAYDKKNNKYNNTEQYFVLSEKEYKNSYKKNIFKNYFEKDVNLYIFKK